jgi:hypothetical protein
MCRGGEEAEKGGFYEGGKTVETRPFNNALTRASSNESGETMESCRGPNLRIR